MSTEVKRAIDVGELRFVDRRGRGWRATMSLAAFHRSSKDPSSIYHDPVKPNTRDCNGDRLLNIGPWICRIDILEVENIDGKDGSAF